MGKRKTLVIIDGKSVFYRGYYAMPNLSLEDGTPTGGVYGFAVMALEVIKKMQPDYVVVAWDKPKTNIRARLKLYDKYKANRKPAPPDFYAQIPLLHRLLEAFGWPLLECDDYEADDIMGTIAVQANKHNVDTMMVTSDLDMIQLVNHHTRLAALKKGLTNIKYYDEESFTEEYGLTPQQFIDVKALKGDSSDNIPGVAGVGEKTGLELIRQYQTLEEVYKHLDDIKPTLRAKLERDKEMAFLSRQLVTILIDAPVKFDIKQADIHKIDPKQVRDILSEFQFKSLLAQLPPTWKVSKSDDAPTISMATDIKLQEMTAKLAGELNDQPPKELAMVAISSDNLAIATSAKTAYALPLKNAAMLEKLLANTKVKKVGYDLKTVAKLLLSQGIELEGIDHDVRIGAFLINSLLREQSLADLVGNGNELEPTQQIAAIYHLLEQQRASFKRLPQLNKLAADIEWPIIPVLAHMEYRGVKLDTVYLSKMSDEFADKISDLTQEMYGHAGMEFNISSPSQLAEVLFEKLQLPTQFIKKTKTGYSTAASELDKLRGLHPIINLITAYRELTKLKSTYIDALPKLVDKSSKLHTTFALDVAPTGRLSSSDPNLQNIPVRTEVGRQIRQAFVAATGNVFVAADYSQFELRIAAALAGETEIIKAYKQGADVHQLTAAAIYDIEPEEVTKEQRYSAKAVNFGIMYGQGAHGLSVGTGMTMKEAREFIDKYFEVRPKIKQLIETYRNQALEQGYVETLFGRRRPTPDVKSSNFMVREGAFRAAVNMPLQGTAADLMKMAMIKIEAELEPDCQQILQIHDSVLVECPKAKASGVAEQVRDIMENIYPELGVRLQVDTAVGEHWGEI